MISLKKEVSFLSCEIWNKIMVISCMWEFCFFCKFMFCWWKEWFDEMRVCCINKLLLVFYKRWNSFLYFVLFVYRFVGWWEWFNVVIFLLVGLVLFFIVLELN